MTAGLRFIAVLLAVSLLPPALPRWNESHWMLGLLIAMHAGIDAGRLLFPVVNKC